MRNLFLISSLCGVVTVMSGCGTTAHRVDASSNRGLTTVDDINFKDWQIAAEKSINSMLASGTLNRPNGKKTILTISTVKNSTTQHVNTRILTDKIRQAVLRSGKALVTTVVGANGAEDKATRNVRRLKNDPLFKQSTVQKNGTVIAPDMSLAGVIVQQKTAVGRSKESYFFIHMTLTDLKTGLAVWEDNVEIVKQSKKSYFGW